MQCKEYMTYLNFAREWYFWTPNSNMKVQLVIIFFTAFNPLLPGTCQLVSPVDSSDFPVPGIFVINLMIIVMLLKYK